MKRALKQPGIYSLEGLRQEGNMGAVYNKMRS